MSTNLIDLLIKIDIIWKKYFFKDNLISNIKVLYKALYKYL